MTGPTQPMHADAGARALDALPPDEAAAFDEHVASCEPCAAEYAEFLDTTAMMAAAVAERPPDRLRGNVLRAAARTPQLPPVTAPGNGPDGENRAHAEPSGRHRRPAPWWRRPGPLVAAAVLAAALIAAGVIVGTRPAGPSPEQAAAQCVAAAPDARVRQPSVGSGGSVTLARSCDAAVVDLPLGAMPELPGDQAYQLWVMAGSAAQSAGLVAQEAGPAGEVVVIGLTASDTAIGVSVEPAGGSKAPTTAPVWVVPLTG